MDISSVDMAGVDIAALSVAMKAEQTETEMDVAVLKNVMDVQNEIAQLIISDLMAVPGKVDILL